MKFFDCNTSFGTSMIRPIQFAETAQELLQEMDHYGISEALVHHARQRDDSPVVGNEMLLDEIADYSIAVGLELIKLGADVMLTGDDIGTDVGPIISPNLWREHLKPRLKRVFDMYKAADPDVILVYHTCGSVLPFIDELIEIGVEVLNPIQVTAHGMDPAAIKHKYGDQLAFCGGIDQRHVLPKGSTVDVDAEVARRITEMGQDGGYVLAPTHDIQADTPVENVLALFAASRKHGGYPLTVRQDRSCRERAACTGHLP